MYVKQCKTERIHTTHHVEVSTGMESHEILRDLSRVPENVMLSVIQRCVNGVRLIFVEMEDTKK